MRRKRALQVTAAVLACALLAVSAGLAGADQLHGDDLESGGNTTKVVGASGSASFYLQAGGSNGCNATAANPVTVAVSSNQSWLTIAAPASLTFTVCRDASNLNAQSIGYTVSGPANVGQVATISGTPSGGVPGDDIQTNHASFTVTIVAGGDVTPPAISYSLNPAAPDGANGWYTSNVALTWTVLEPQSPGSLTTTGCVNQTITADQAETTYSCSATSAGGASGPVSVAIKRDATAPAVTLTGGPAEGVTYYENYNVPSAPSCDATDATSGVNGVCSVNGYSSAPGQHTVSASATDNAGNTGTSAAVTYTVLEDTTPPDIQGILNPATADGSNGWYKSNVSLTWQVAEPETGGSLSKTDCIDQSVTTDQLATGYDCSASSVGGSAGPITVTIKRDATAPTVTLVDGPVSGAIYYENYDVPAAPTCTAIDATSDVNGNCSVTGYGSTAGSHTVSAEATDFAGNTGTSASITYTVLEDTTPPVIQFTRTPATPDGANGWYTGSVTLTWSVTDAETPNSIVIDDGCANQSITADQVSTPYSCTAHSLGGSAGPITTTIQRDATPPTVTLNGGPANGGTYYEGYDVPGAPTCDDDDITSGVDVGCAVTGYGNTEGSWTVSASATDFAGNVGTSSSVTYTVLKDVTGPVIDHTVTPAAPDGNNGWYKSNVSLTWTVTEPETTTSLSKNGCEDQSLTADQQATQYGCSATSVGGSSGPVTVTIQRDATPPVLTCTASRHFILNGAGTVTASVTDATAGPTSSTASAPADTSSTGSKSVTLTGFDNAGNSASKVCTYTVGYNFIGFSSPVDNPGWINKLKAGQAIPLKWRLLDANGQPVTNLATAVLTVQGQTCSSMGSSVDLVEETVAGSSGLQNLGNGYYQLNWKSPTSYANSCKELTLSLGEGASHTHDTWFMFTK